MHKGAYPTKAEADTSYFGTPMELGTPEDRHVDDIARFLDESPSAASMEEPGRGQLEREEFFSDTKGITQMHTTKKRQNVKTGRSDFIEKMKKNQSYNVTAQKKAAHKINIKVTDNQQQQKTTEQGKDKYPKKRNKNKNKKKKLNRKKLQEEKQEKERNDKAMNIQVQPESLSTKTVEEEEDKSWNEWNYWKMPLPDVFLDDLNQ
jgi:hypothetical protein